MMVHTNLDTYKEGVQKLKMGKSLCIISVKHAQSQVHTTE